MTDKLPPNLLALFAPRPALRYLPPSDHAPEQRKTNAISGVGAFLGELKTYEKIPYEPSESWLQKRDRVKAEKKERQEQLLGEGFEKFNPADDQQVRGDAYKTLFVARLSYDAKELDLEKEFGRYGPIERIRIVTDTHEQQSGDASKKKKHRGYAFIVYEREKDMKAAYKETDGIRIKDRKVLVDVERGRTVKGWRPRRYGGGLGGRGYTKATPARPTGFTAPAGPGGPGGFRGGGFRGSFNDRGSGGFRGGGFRGDRGGFGARGGIGYQGGGGFGGGGGGRGGYSSGAPPPNAPSGPGGGGRPAFGGSGGFGAPPAGGMNGAPPPPEAVNGGGYGDRRNGSYDDRSSYRSGSGRSYSDRDGRSGGFTGSNREPVRPREGGYSDRDRPRDNDRGYSSRRDDDYGSRKRHHDGDGYDDPRKRRY